MRHSGEVCIFKDLIVAWNNRDVLRGTHLQRSYCSLKQWGILSGIHPQRSYCSLKQWGIHLQRSYCSLKQWGIHLQRSYFSLTQWGIHLQRSYCSLKQWGIHLQRSYCSLKEWGTVGEVWNVHDFPVVTQCQGYVKVNLSIKQRNATTVNCYRIPRRGRTLLVTF